MKKAANANVLTYREREAANGGGQTAGAGHGSWTEVCQTHLLQQEAQQAAAHSTA